MKKYICIIIVLCLIIPLCACGGSNANDISSIKSAYFESTITIGTSREDVINCLKGCSADNDHMITVGDYDTTIWFTSKGTVEAMRTRCEEGLVDDVTKLLGAPAEKDANSESYKWVASLDGKKVVLIVSYYSQFEKDGNTGWMIEIDKK